MHISIECETDDHADCSVIDAVYYDDGYGLYVYDCECSCHERMEECKNHWTKAKCDCVKKAQEEDLKKRMEETT